MTDRRTVVLGRDVLELVTDILDAFAAANEIEPKLFVFGNHLARVREGERQHLELVNAQLLTHDATELCRWVKVRGLVTPLPRLEYPERSRTPSSTSSRCRNGLSRGSTG